MVADLKYNALQGVKICEVQQATLSLFNGDSFRDKQEASIHKELLRTLSLYNKNGWVVADSIADKKLVSTLAGSQTWCAPKDIIALFSDPDFRRRAKLPASDIHGLVDYQGFLYLSWSQLHVISDFEERLPGLIVMDKSSFPLWIDKYQMTRLFAEDELLSSVKPKWGNYKKHYTKKLATKVAEDLKCDTFVIKPRGNFMGRGVIITSLNDLDEVLRYIITKKGALAESKDPAFAAWKRDTFDSFVVEEFVTSDPIKLPHLENKAYQPTMRVAFLLVYSNRQHHVHFLGEYWKTPELSIDEEGDFMHKNKDICEPPYYLAVDTKTKRLVQDELRAVLPTLHRKMIEYSNSLDEFYAPASKGNVQLIMRPVSLHSA